MTFPKLSLPSRRRVIQAGSIAATGSLLGWAPNLFGRSNGVASAQSLSCLATPALTEGPYFVDDRLNRADIRIDPLDGSVQEGVPLQLNLKVYVASPFDGSCVPLAGTYVDVWHCDYRGVYSDVTDPGFNTKGQKFLRGYQVTDSTGGVQFSTVYPGWYSGRAVHIHFKVRSNLGTNSGYEFTSQWFFDDNLTDAVHARSPHAAKGQRDLRNANDDIYKQSGGKLNLQLTPSGDGYVANYTIGLSIIPTGASQSAPGGQGGPPPGGGPGGPGGPGGAPISRLPF